MTYSLLQKITHDAANTYSHLDGIGAQIERGGEIDREELVATLRRVALRVQQLSFLARGSTAAYDQAEDLLREELDAWRQRGRPSVVRR